jgi:ferredoxin
VHINASCNGKGACGKGKLILESGTVEPDPTPLLTDQEKENNYLLA